LLCFQISWFEDSAKKTHCFDKERNMDKVYIQLFSMGREFSGTLTEALEIVSRIGYAGIEFAGRNYGGLSASEMKRTLKNLNLEPLGTHVVMNAVLEDLDYMVDIGGSYMDIVYANFKNREETLAVAERMNHLGRECNKRGLRLAYHNHCFEFNSDGGEYLMDILIANTDPELLTFELDTGWATLAGIDPLAFLKKHAGRFELIHAKESLKPKLEHIAFNLEHSKRSETGGPILSDKMRMYTQERAKLNVKSGTGDVDFPAIKAAADAQGSKAYVIEREYSYIPRVDALKEDFAYMRSL
jgi:sugar phosphate isomerase/epimerase